MHRKPELDGLRALAFLAVFHSHVHASDGTRTFLFGRFGVDVFFALSAYLIGSLLLGELERTGDISLRRFYLRRALRILPLYFAALAISAAVWPGRNPGAFFALVGNLEVARLGHWHTISPLLGPLWSTCMEEQFYALAPLLAILGRRAMFRSAVGMLVVAFAVRFYLATVDAPQPTIWTFPLGRLDSLAVGLLLAARGLPQLSRVAGVVLFVAGWAGLLGAELAWPLTGEDWNSVPTLTLVAFASGAIVAGAAAIPTLGSRWLVLLGERSYGLYVFHSAAVFFLPWPAALAATVVLSAASYRFLELPFLRLKERWSASPSQPVVLHRA